MQVLLEELDRRRILQKEQMPTAPKANSKALTRQTTRTNGSNKGSTIEEQRPKGPCALQLGWCGVRSV